MRSVGGVPLDVAVTLPSVTVLQVLRLPVSAETGAEQVSVAEILAQVVRLALPMLYLPGELVLNPAERLT